MSLCAVVSLVALDSLLSWRSNKALVVSSKITCVMFITDVLRPCEEIGMKVN